MNERAPRSRRTAALKCESSPRPVLVGHRYGCIDPLVDGPHLRDIGQRVAAVGHGVAAAGALRGIRIADTSSIGVLAAGVGVRYAGSGRVSVREHSAVAGDIKV